MPTSKWPFVHSNSKSQVQSASHAWRLHRDRFLHVVAEMDLGLSGFVSIHGLQQKKVEIINRGSLRLPAWGPDSRHTQVWVGRSIPEHLG